VTWLAVSKAAATELVEGFAGSQPLTPGMTAINNNMAAGKVRGTDGDSSGEVNRRYARIIACTAIPA
jgi:hypothetical protein